MDEYYLYKSKKIIDDNHIFIKNAYIIPINEYSIEIIFIITFIYNEFDNKIKLKFFAVKKGELFFGDYKMDNIIKLLNFFIKIFNIERDKVEKEYNIKFNKVEYYSDDFRKKRIYERVINNYYKNIIIDNKNDRGNTIIKILNK